MIPYETDYVRAATLTDALSLLAAESEAKILAGGHSLIPIMKLRLARPSKLIDVAHLPELRGIEIGNDVISIGSATTHAELEESAQLKLRAPLFAAVGAVIADPAVRNRGTIGGALVNADPSADWPAAMLALGAEMEISSLNGTRHVAATDFFVGFLTSAVQPKEILTRIYIPDPAGTHVGYRKFRHPASGYAVAAAAVNLRFVGGRCTGGKIGITGVAATAFRPFAAEALLAQGCSGRPEEIEKIAAEAFSNVEALDDNFADAAYRLQLGRTMLKRALGDAFAAPG
jgi:aerobic carbon-monoxide dehydrogenase medium subunit